MRSRAARMSDSVGMSSVRGNGRARRRGQHDALEEEGRELGAAAEPGLLVDGDRMLANRALAAPRLVRDHLVALPLEETQRHVALGGGEAPRIEALVHRATEPLEG